jgi:hypothetical protein
MRAVAERGITCTFALAQGYGLFLGNFDDFGGEFGAFMRTVAKWLVGGLAAGTPVVGAGFKIENCRFFCCNNCFTHGSTPYVY